MAMNFRTIQGCPVDAGIGPYIAVVVNDAKATVNSIYRGQDAAAILNAHGKHTQAQLYQMYLNGQGAPANPPGFSTHELRSDGVAYPGIARGLPIPWWAQGFDVNDSDVINCIHAAARYGWTLFQPYHSGAEFHHLNWARQPRPSPFIWPRIVRLRRTLPRH